MLAIQAWNDIVAKAKQSTFETHTRPQNNRTPLWFRVGVIGNALVIQNSLENQPSVKLSMERKITFKDFELVYSYYDLWLEGQEGIRQVVTKKSENTTYIFALIAEQRKWSMSGGVVMS